MIWWRSSAGSSRLEQCNVTDRVSFIAMFSTHHCVMCSVTDADVKTSIVLSSLVYFHYALCLFTMLICDVYDDAQIFNYC